MKKKLIFAGATLLLAAAAVTVYSTSNKSSISDLLNANVEALANGEDGGKPCYNTVTNESEIMTFYCGTCSYIPGAPGKFSGKGTC